MSRTIDLGLLLGIAPAGAVVVPSVTIQTDELQSQAIYANAFYNLTDTLELSAGIRFDHQEVNVYGTAANTPPTNGSRGSPWPSTGRRTTPPTPRSRAASAAAAPTRPGAPNPF